MYHVAGVRVGMIILGVLPSGLGFELEPSLQLLILVPSTDAGQDIYRQFIYTLYTMLLSS